MLIILYCTLYNKPKNKGFSIVGTSSHFKVWVQQCEVYYPILHYRYNKPNNKGFFYCKLYPLLRYTTIYRGQRTKRAERCQLGMPAAGGERPREECLPLHLPPPWHRGRNRSYSTVPTTEGHTKEREGRFMQLNPPWHGKPFECGDWNVRTVCKWNCLISLDSLDVVTWG